MHSSRRATPLVDGTLSGGRRRQWPLQLLLAVLLTVQALTAANAVPEPAEGIASSRHSMATIGVDPRWEITLRQAVERDPASFEANYKLGEFYVQMRRLRAAIPYLKKAYELNPANFANGYDLALAYFETNDLLRARRQILGMLGQRDNSELHNLLGDVEEKSGDPVRAAAEYQLAAQQDPSEQNIFDWGDELLHQGAFENAEKVFSAGADHYPNSPRLHIGLGTALYSRGFYDDAARELCRASDLEPSDLRPYFFLGKLIDTTRSQAGEIQARLRRFVQSHPRNAMAHYYYAMSLLKGQRIPEGEAEKREVAVHLKQATALDPTMVEAHLHLGIFYADQDKLPQAILEYRRAIQLKPDLATAHYRLAQIYRRSGDSLHAQQEMKLFQGMHARQATVDSKK